MATQQQPPSMGEEDRINNEHPLATSEQRVSILKKNSIFNKPPPQKLVLKNIGSVGPSMSQTFVNPLFFSSGRNVKCALQLKKPQSLPDNNTMEAVSSSPAFSRTESSPAQTAQIGPKPAIASTVTTSAAMPTSVATTTLSKHTFVQATANSAKRPTFFLPPGSRPFKVIPPEKKIAITSKNLSQILAKHMPKSTTTGYIRVPNPYATPSSTPNVVVNSMNNVTVRIPSSTIITTKNANNAKNSMLLQNQSVHRPNMLATVPRLTVPAAPLPTVIKTEPVEFVPKPCIVTTIPTTLKPILPKPLQYKPAPQRFSTISTTNNTQQSQMMIITHNKVTSTQAPISSTSTIGSPIHVGDFLKTYSREGINVTAAQAKKAPSQPPTETTQKNTISLQISNGRLSDPNGPIKILSSGSNTSTTNGGIISVSPLQKAEFIGHKEQLFKIRMESARKARETKMQNSSLNEITLLKIPKTEISKVVKQPQHSLTKMTISTAKPQAPQTAGRPAATVTHQVLYGTNKKNPYYSVSDARLRRLLTSPRLFKRSKSFTAKFQQETARFRRLKRLSESGIDGTTIKIEKARVHSRPLNDEEIMRRANAIKKEFDEDALEENVAQPQSSTSASVSLKRPFDVEKSIEDIIHTNMIHKNGIQSYPNKHEFNLLLCDEKLENSSEYTNSSSCDSLAKSKSLSPPKVDGDSQIYIDNGPKAFQSEVIYRPIVANPVKIIKQIIEENRLELKNEEKRLSQLNKESFMKDTFRRVRAMRPKQIKTSPFDDQVLNDPANLINWNDGVGFLKESKLHFQFNEFGLIEILDEADYERLQNVNIDKLYGAPLEKRKADTPSDSRMLQVIKKENLDTFSSELDPKVYHCSGCGVKGLAHDFIAPEFCSISCFKNIKILKIQNNTDKRSSQGKRNDLENQPKVFRYRQRRIRPKPKIYDGQNELASFCNKISRNTMISQLDQDDDENDEDGSEFRLAEKLMEPQPSFDWDDYLAHTCGTAAPLNLFINPFPCSPNPFVVGMKLEAIDPENCSLFCVCSVVEIRGYRLRLHFDGYSSYYDFWVNADSMDIFPPGWCRKTNRSLQIPPAEDETFEWSDYLRRTNCLAATRSLFTHLNSSSLHKNPFENGMKLEADDVKNSGRICVATVIDVLENRILIHFDGWDQKYDYWVDISSSNIHPINWHKENGYALVPPPDLKTTFTWHSYLEEKKAVAAPEILFCTRDSFEFRPGMKLEIVDRKNPSLIRVATVMDVNSYELKVLYDGWPSIYAFWMEDDSVDIHPVRWSHKTNHPIEFPPGYGSIDSTNRCGILGCRGLGNTKYTSQNSHNCLDECPYEIKNWTKILKKLDRLKSKPILHKNSRQRVRVRQESGSLSSNSAELPTTRKRPNERESDFVLFSKNPDQKRLRRISSDFDVTLDLAADRKDFDLQIEQRAQASEKPKKSILETALRLSVTKTFLADYGPRLKQAHDLWTENSKMLDISYDITSKLYEKNPFCWTLEEVAEYVGQLPNCADIAEKFEQEEIDGAALLSLTQEDLMKLMDVKLGPAIKIYNRILALREYINVKFLRK